MADYNYDWEYWFDADGNFIYVSPSCQRISGYEPKAFYDNENLLIDITHNKNTELKIAQTEHKLKESLQAKDKFLSIIAHDLRSPFQSILGFSNLLTENFDDFSEKEKKKFIGIIHLGISSTYGLLENLLLWSHAQKGSIRFQPESLNLFLLVHEIKDILNQSFLKKGIVFKVKIDEDIYAKADRDMLSTIIRNLLSNAIKFTPKKGAIEISAKVITESEKQTYTEVTINDNGVEIPDDVQKKLFSIDENTSTKGTENESGTGLGLILCKEFISRHGSDIHIESEEGVGSSFVFTIPSNLE